MASSLLDANISDCNADARKTDGPPSKPVAPHEKDTTILQIEDLPDAGGDFETLIAPGYDIGSAANKRFREMVLQKKQLRDRRNAKQKDVRASGRRRTPRASGSSAPAAATGALGTQGRKGTDGPQVQQQQVVVVTGAPGIGSTITTPRVSGRCNRCAGNQRNNGHMVTVSAARGCATSFGSDSRRQ
ncbi:hypothetical protein EVAR_38811_1 [Eumeta japonica]|uniref:Uncharacterized protein n=1 Tax=Eumeta variegata TaxID=151549 RepID=A0A4C1TL95_EUMVA|nr:hypothetical protein EVAR_38811_1 [Eumeta japonica]